VRLAVYLIFVCIPQVIWAGDYSTQVKNIAIEKAVDSYNLDASIVYSLSPVAKEALQKGIPLTWAVLIKVKKQGLLWDRTLEELVLSFQLQSHALLNLYSIKNVSTGKQDMFSTFAGALDYMSRIRDLAIVNKALISPDQTYYVAVKVEFDHESLPVPIRPFSYFDQQWALSSAAMLCPIKN